MKDTFSELALIKPCTSTGSSLKVRSGKCHEAVLLRMSRILVQGERERSQNALAELKARQESEQALSARELSDAHQKAMLSERQAEEKLRLASVSSPNPTPPHPADTSNNISPYQSCKHWIWPCVPLLSNRVFWISFSNRFAEAILFSGDWVSHYEGKTPLMPWNCTTDLG